uniref:Uncharacterized protein n=1 Tax=Panagrolaimus davidi TaxID=227884 RepID=A0A914NX82_9BILA
MDDLKHEKDASQRVEDKLYEYKLLVAQMDESIEKSKNEMHAKILENETLLERTSAEYKEQEKNQKETYELQLAQTKKEYDLKTEEFLNDFKKAKEKVEDDQSVAQMDLDTDFSASFGGGDYTTRESEYDHVEDVVAEVEVQTYQASNGSDTVQHLRDTGVLMQASPGSTSTQSNIVCAPNYRLGIVY